MDTFFVITPEGCQLQLPEFLTLPEQDIWRRILKTEKDSVKSTSGADIARAMHRMDWADPETSSDKGHFRFYPVGTLILSLICDWLDLIATNMYESSAIITPSMYDWEEPATQVQAGIFDGCVYHVRLPDRDTDFALKFNGDIGLFKMMANSCLEQGNMPTRVHEMVRGFRFIQSGQISHIGRGRTFALLDMKSFCTDQEQAIKEYVYLHQNAHDFLGSAGHQSYSLLRTTCTYLESAKRAALQIAQIDNHPVVVKVLSEQKQYWCMKHTIFTPHPEKVVQIQLDLENATRFGVSHLNCLGTKSFGPIIHNSLGSAERWMTLFLRDALSLKVPKLPVWLSPIQVRVIPVSEKHAKQCLELVRSLRQHNIRVDMENRPGSLNKHIKVAERCWIPYIIIYGDDEMNSANLAVRIRGDKQTKMSLGSLITHLSDQIKGKPFRALPHCLASRHLEFVKMC